MIVGDGIFVYHYDTVSMSLLLITLYYIMLNERMLLIKFEFMISRLMMEIGKFFTTYETKEEFYKRIRYNRELHLVLQVLTSHRLGVCIREKVSMTLYVMKTRDAFHSCSTIQAEFEFKRKKILIRAC